jgi:glycine/D-amino acid oxidase-like deaminating enzyme
MFMADFGILGFGMAGATLAGELLARGARKVVVAGRDLPGAASPIAPGLVNPLAGRKLKPDPRMSAWYEALQGLDLRWGSFFGESFWRDIPIVRILEDAKQVERLEAITPDAAEARWIAERWQPGTLGPLVNDECGSFLTAGSGWFDIPRFITRMASHPQLEWIDPDDVEHTADRWIDCRGWRCAFDSRWRMLPWNCVRGEFLELELTPGQLATDRIWNRGLWLRPAGGWRWLVGSTYAWDEATFANQPTKEAAAQLLDRLAQWFQGEPRIVGQHAGTRAVVRDYRPVLGPSPEDDRWLLFSGLGSKGALLGPFYGAAMASHLIDGSPLPEEASLARFL